MKRKWDLPLAFGLILWESPGLCGQPKNNRKRCESNTRLGVD